MCFHEADFKSDEKVLVEAYFWFCKHKQFFMNNEAISE